MIGRVLFALLVWIDMIGILQDRKKEVLVPTLILLYISTQHNFLLAISRCNRDLMTEEV